MGTTYEEDLHHELARIRNNQFDIRGYFTPLFSQLFAKKKQVDPVLFVNDLIDESGLADVLQKKYIGVTHVLMLYAHKPHSPAYSPYFPKEPRAHVSLLLCRVDKNIIQNILNIDSLNHPMYVDILGERPGAKAHPYIKQRLLIQTAEGKSLQRPSWMNMNSILYAFAFAERILELFKSQPELMKDLLPAEASERASHESLFLLHDAMLEGMIDKYVKKDGFNLVYDENLRDTYHNKIRNTLALSLEKLIHEEIIPQKTAQEEHIQTSTFADSYKKTTNVSNENKASSHISDCDINYSFLLKAGAILSATLSASAFVAAAIALSASASVLVTAGIAAALLSGGLFKLGSNRQQPGIDGLSTEPSTNKPT